MRKLLAAVALCGLVCTSVAKTTTWTGNAGTTDISTAGNWDNGAPEPGDCLVFLKAADLTGSMDLGSQTLTIQVSAAVNSKATFSGTGGIAVQAGYADAKAFVQKAADMGSFAGGLTIESGYFNLSVGSTISLGASSVPVTVRRPAQLRFMSYDVGLANDLVVDGNGTGTDWAAIFISNKADVKGGLSANTDFSVSLGWDGVTFCKDVSAPGRKIAFTCTAFDNHNCEFQGAVDASVAWKAAGKLTLRGQTLSTEQARDAVLSATTGTVELTSTATWAGTNIVLSGAATVLALKSGSNIRDAEGVFALSDGARLSLGSGVTVIARAMVVDGTFADGAVFSAANHPEAISGSGRMLVGTVRTWQGPSGGMLSDAANWKEGLPPQTGCIVYFPQKATIGTKGASPRGVFDIGADGLTIVNDDAVTCYVELTGEGPVVKYGAGGLEFYYSCTFAGDCRIGEGFVNIGDASNNRMDLGQGTVIVDKTGGSSAQLYQKNYGSGLNNDVRIVGSTASSSAAIILNNLSSIYGDVTSDGDFLVHTDWTNPGSPMGLRGRVSAPGKTMTVEVLSQWGESIGAFLGGEVNANVVHAGAGFLELRGVSTNPDASFSSTSSSSNRFTTAACWAGTNVVLSGANAVTYLTSEDNLSEDAVVRLTNGSKLNVAAGVRAHVAALYVGGERVRDGFYTAASLPQALSGAGRLKVGSSGFVIFFR